MNCKYYVYLYLRDNGTPYYCGKGKGKRAYRKGSPNTVKLVATHLTESEAFELEKRLIKLYGRKDLGSGILNNRTDGGEGSSGAVRSSEFRLRVSTAKKGISPSDEHRKNLSAARKGKPLTEAHRNALKKPRSEEAKLNMSRGCMGRKISEETKAKISATLKARLNLKSS
jgi:hypothetical protein